MPSNRRRSPASKLSCAHRSSALRIATAALLACGFFWARESVASSDCAERIAARVQARYDEIDDFEARFEQSTSSVMLGTSPMADAEPTRGRVTLAKPGKMRWEYETPQPSLMVSDGATLWLYDPVAKEAQRLHSPEGYLRGAAVHFLLGEGDLLEHFSVSAKDCDGVTVEIELLPREESTYERLSIRAIAESGDIVETRIVDLFGNVTRVAFSDLRTNRKPDAALFHFDPPGDVTVIDFEVPE